VAAATGAYTLPSWDNAARSRGYGCVSDTSEPWAGINADGTSYDCAHFHGGIDFRLSYDPVVSARAGVVVTTIDTNPDNPGSVCVTNRPANIIVIDHGGGQYSAYLHLTQDGSDVVVGQNVSAGQLIATSGNSGFTCGAHLHYMLSNSPTSLSAPHTFNPDGKWTTASGRAPWLDDFVAQQSGTAALGNLDVCYGQTATYWVKFKNLGGRTWPWVNDLYNRGKVVLYSTSSTGQAALVSQLQASDWETASRVTPADTPSVAPDGTGTFTFGVQGNGTEGQSYTLYVNLDAFGLHWFKYNDQVRVSVFVVPHQGCT
jgi:hypothetical protein